ncbi:hypothetical protein PISMIDRAFT_18189 [Pisolithus microcarpus 441]|uniref:Uncharacterized protein n=1 Tax=Pisolithus microcarpus 441 TaxID=765257 RepID=A0A0C9YZ72_9AGAM|nr:hypothetical protein PISMIDRAFT_18189 [Pisolithus microcarpus 441]
MQLASLVIALMFACAAVASPLPADRDSLLVRSPSEDKRGSGSGSTGNEAGAGLTSEEPPLRLTCTRLALLSPFSPPYPPLPFPLLFGIPNFGRPSLTARADSDLSYSDAPSIIPHTSKTGFFARPIQTIHIKPSEFSPFIYNNHRGA